MFISEKSYFYTKILKTDEIQVKEIISSKTECYSEFEIPKKMEKERYML
ncbi:hypothetical protein [Ruminiclostridium cellobioparum]|uniref:Uncharacterized protein n=1 Tax=Ruminiclostridium cellobioparum subsp. termitidis CT1112 TaxID=1195236 RepID=S0FI40_RUMCE|nr:hypothetical protein [Ruminiclostridium cellobioparum]EMS71252.1 hypothetical protein CTER_2881 [Ruminiclostridium cellobioparum subsp. termitidis CT1112]